MKKRIFLIVVLIVIAGLCIKLADFTKSSDNNSNLTGSVIAGSTTNRSYTNSPLVSYTKLSPSHSGQRTKDIDTITIHSIAGQYSVERMGEIFAPTSRMESFNYGVGVDGRIGLYVEEKNRSIASSSNANDQRAITIVVTTDTIEPYAVNDKAYKATIKLIADICKRNGIKELVWSTDKNQRANHLNGCNMTVHRDFTSTSCPGKFLYDRMGDIASKVNAIL